ncbi:Sulfotransferase 1A4 [Amphibalanus amphitrite]|uniref:Sulfotransferase 1A4 n=1 Tax=Amphibalanus amphitrite TaxID=1232801 RepID=A0A6A4VJK3_AMPAM|nr:Sulfotransferase 1A4 [Amphibalanus amphitrite]
MKASVLNLPRMLLAAARRAWYRHQHPPRFVKTHMPLSMLPPRLLDECRVVYVARNPKDALVSYYHHHKLFLTYGFDGTFEEFFDLQAWEKRLHPNLLFVFFEEMELNLTVVIRRVADFLRKNLSDEDVAALHSHLQFSAMSENPHVQLHWLREAGLLSEGHSLFRRGRTGDWKNYFTPAMDARMTAWIEENLRGSDLRFITELEQRD